MLTKKFVNQASNTSSIVKTHEKMYLIEHANQIHLFLLSWNNVLRNDYGSIPACLRPSIVTKAPIPARSSAAFVQTTIVRSWVVL